MQRRPVVRPSQADRRANADRKNADERDRVVKPGTRQRHRLEADSIGASTMRDALRSEHPPSSEAWSSAHARNGRDLAVDGQQQVASAARTAPRAWIGNLTATTFCLLPWQDAVFRSPSGLDQRHVDDSEATRAEATATERDAQQRPEARNGDIEI